MQLKSVSTRSELITVVSLHVSLGKMDGGGRRVAAFRRALDSVGTAAMVPVGPIGQAANDTAVQSPIHRAKRRLLPVPLRTPIARTLARQPRIGPTVSLTPAAHHWSLQCGPTWLDYPDLWSEMARNQARTVDPVSASFNLAQARVWGNREIAESLRAEVVSVASWADRDRLGGEAVWLPTPVADRFIATRRPHTADARSCGMIANFDYPPNRDAYHRLVTEWMPRLTPTFDRVIVAGYGSEQLPQSPHVEIAGVVPSVAEFYQHVDAVVAPIELGAGMKVKVVEAMMHGVPVIASEHAAEGLPPAVTAACMDIRAPWWSTSDPRGDSAVAAELQHFTFDSFNKQFRSTWTERMDSHHA
jgi:hypothetical protein